MATWARTFAMFSLLVLLLVYFLYPFFSFLEVTGRRAFDPGLYLGIFYSLIPGAALLTFIVSYWRQMGEEGHSPLQMALHAYPRYVWDIYAWMVATVTIWIVLLVLIVAFFVEFGFDADPDFTRPIGDEEVDRYQSIQVVAGLGAYLGFFLTVYMLYAYAFHTYPLESLPRIQNAMAQRGDLGDIYRQQPYQWTQLRAHAAPATGRIPHA